MTVTVVRGLTPAVTAAWCPVQNTSDRVSSDGSSASSSPAGSLTSVPWACGTRTASPCPPSQLAAPLAAVAAGGLQALAAEVAGAVRPHERRHHQVAGLEAGHLGAGVLDHAEELVAHPAAVLRRPGIDPYGHRSLPQMQDRSTRTIASVGSRRTGSGTSSTRTSPAPYIKVARIRKSFRSWSSRDLEHQRPL